MWPRRHRVCQKLQLYTILIIIFTLNELNSRFGSDNLTDEHCDIINGGIIKNYYLMCLHVYAPVFVLILLKYYIYPIGIPLADNKVPADSSFTKWL